MASTESTTTPTLGPIRRESGVAGQFALVVDVTYPGEPTRTVSFVGSVYGGPVVMIDEHDNQTFVTEPGRFGEFGKDWVKAFFEAA